MYRITYVHKNESTENPLYIAGDDDYCLTAATLDLECGKSGELNISLPDINPAKEDILCLTDEVIVYRNSEEIWRGRPVTLQMDFDRTGTLTCEGILSYLYDTAFPPFEFEGSPKEFLEMVLDNHNSQVEERKQFTMGNITVVDNNDYINRSSIYYDKSLNVLTEKLIEDSLGGYFRVRIEGDTRYLDYLETYDTQATQMVQYGENILDIAEEIEYSDLATVILPLGAKLKDDEGMDTDEYLTIASVNGGSYYYADEAAVATYGWIVVIAEWEDVTIASNLLEKAKTYLAQCTNAISSFTVNAIDLSLISDEEPIRLGDYVWIRSIPHGINQYIELTEQHIDILYPENDVLSFGTDTTTLTGSQKTTDRAIQSALGSINMRVTNLSADVINAVYANIETIVADTVNANYIYGIVAELGYLTADEIEARYVSIENLYADVANMGFLTADSAYIENLVAFSESVYTLLGGIGSFGTLDSIHLSSDNAVIDEAVIVEAIAGTVIADILNAGYINTDEITIKSDSGGYITSGATTQYYDSEGNIRIQIGLDESGNFTFILYDADGEGILIDENGIRASAVPDGLIVDSMVSETAAIQGSKIDMVTLTSCLNEYGQLVMDASKVTLDDQTLDVWYTQVTQTLEGLEGLTAEGLMDVVPYFALGDSPTEPPPYDGRYTASLLGTMELGNTLLGVSESEPRWTTEPLTAGEGEYLWVCFQGLYADRHTEWTTPYCLTDGYLRTETSTLQTEFSVVQGQIESRIWKTDITEALDEYDTTIEEQFSDVNQTIGNITSVVGEIETSYGEISARVTSVEQTAQGLISSVADVQSSLDNGMETLESEIEQLAGSISMSVTSSESGTASIVLTVDGEEAGSGTFVSEARTAFERENTAIIISAGTVTFNDNLLIVNGTNFTLDADGNATFAGELKAPGGTIGGFTIGETELYRNAASFDDYTQGAVYVGNNGIRVNGQYIQVRISGQRSGETYQGMSFFYYNGVASEMSEALLCGMIRTAYFSSIGDRLFEISDGNNVYFLSCDTYISTYGTGLVAVGSTTYVLSLNGSTIYGLSAIATVSELSIDDGAATLAAPNFRDPGHDMMANLVSHTYEVEGRQHVGLAVDEVEAAMQAAGMNPDEYDITDRWTDEDGTEKGAIRYDELIPMLISEVQSINSRLDALEEV